MIAMVSNGNGSSVSIEGGNSKTLSSVSGYEEILSTSGDDLENRSGNGNDPVAAYLAEGESNEVRTHEWTYNSNLGLSIEKIKEGFTFESLWEVVENNNKNWNKKNYF